MQAPIAITRNNANATSSGGRQPGSYTSNGILGSSFIGASSGSFREAIAASFGKDAADIMDYSIARLSSSTASTDSDMTALPSTSVPRNKLESAFCRNFKCCGQALENLHDLLQHYEEAHVKFEDDDVPAMITDDENQSPSSSATSSQPPSPKSINAAANAAAAVAAAAASSNASALSDLASGSIHAVPDTNENLSAFDTTIMRSPFKGKKRSFGQFANNSANGQVHQNLRRALIDGGLARSNSRSSSVYSANSPFSTPGSSIPGTPTLDSEGDSAFFGSSSTVPAFSSLSLRNANEEHDLPSCAPPNLFFPSAGASSSNATTSGLPPTKQQKTSNLSTAANAAIESSLSGLGGMGDRPYKCTSPGCDKAYKQMNGLKYHRLHGQCNQNNLSPQQHAISVVSEKANAAMDGSNPSSALASASSSGPNGRSLSGPLTPTSENGETSPTGSSPESSRASVSVDNPSAGQNKVEKMYICQVGPCGKRYKNLNGLRYHYLHSGSHGLLGLQLLHANGGGPSARADATTGRPAISTNDLSSDALAAAAQAAAAQQQAKHRNALLQQQQQQQQKELEAASALNNSKPMPSVMAPSLTAPTAPPS